MADNQILVGSEAGGTAVASDDISSVHYFRGKQALGADGTNTADWAGRDLGSGDGAGYVDSRAFLFDVAVTPTISTGVYAAGDSVGGEMEFASVFRAAGGVSVLDGVVVGDADSEDAALDLLLFDAAISGTHTDNAPFDPTDGDLPTLVAVVPVAAADYVTMADNSVAFVGNLGLTVTGTGTSLWGYLVTSGTPTYTATTDIDVRLLGRKL